MFRRNVIFLAAVGILGLSSIAFAQASLRQSSEPTPTKDRPIIELDLHKFGYTSVKGDMLKAGQVESREIDFTDDRTLVWAWMTRDNSAPNVKLGDPYPPQTGHLHAVTIDVASGREKAIHEWPVYLEDVRYGVVRNGNFLLCTDNKVRLFSANFEVLRETQLPAAAHCTMRDSSNGGGVSSNRKFMVFSTSPEQASRFGILDTDTLEVVSTSSGDKSIHVTDMSDHSFAGMCGKPSLVCISLKDGAWQTYRLAGPSDLTPPPVGGRAMFLNDDTLLIRTPNVLTVAKLEGLMLLQTNLPGNRSYETGRAEISTGGNRFAAMENRRRGVENSFMDWGTFPSNDRILVYDIIERRAIFAVKVQGDSPFPLFNGHTNANSFAVSPDGNQLAVVSDGVLKIYKLPDHLVAH
jgi:hypothetical protein